MRIEKLVGRLKGVQFDHRLGAVNLIRGRNFAGKTARLDAARLALLGYLPELGKTTQATIQLAAGTQLVAQAVMDSGAEYARSWALNGRSWKASQSVTGPEIPPVLLDPSVYFGLGEKDRVRFVFGLCECPVTAEKVLADLKAVRCEPHAELHESALRNLVRTLDEQERAAHDAGKTVQEWLGEAIAYVRDQGKVAKAHADRLVKTVEGMAVLGGETGRDRSKEIEKLRRDEQSAKAARFCWQERIARERRNQAERDALLAEIGRYSDPAAQIAALDAELAKPAPVAPDFTAGRELAAAYASRKADVERYVREIQNLRSDIAALDLERERAIAKPACPTCGCKGKAFKDAVAKLYGDRRAGLIENLTSAEAALPPAEAAMVKARNEVNEFTAASERYASAVAKRQVLEQERRRLISGQEQIVKVRARLEAVPRDEVDLDEMGRHERNLGLEIEAIGGALRAQEAEHRLWQQARARAATTAKATLEAEDAKAQVAVLAAVLKSLETIQAAVADAAVSALMDKANRFVAGILPHPLSYREGAIGMARPTGWVPHEAFSGTEKLVAYAALAAALAQQSPIKLVLMDELGRLNPETKAALLERMVRLAEAGDIDQFIGAEAGEGDVDLTVIA